MNRINNIFENAKKENKTVFIPYITFGVPTLEKSLKYAEILFYHGADILEIGIPFSDPIADGKIIRNASNIALKNNINFNQILEKISNLRKKFPNKGLIIFSYYNIIFKYRLEKFSNKCKKIGIDGTLIVDIPLEERDEILEILDKNNISFIPLIAPTTDIERAKKIIFGLKNSFIYIITTKGTTGERKTLPKDIKERTKQIKSISNLPLALGFGISTKKQVNEISRIADGFIIGSKIVHIILEKNPEKNLKKFLNEILK